MKLVKRANKLLIAGLYPQHVENVHYLIKLTSSSNITFSRNLAGCQESLRVNQSDFSWGHFSYFDPTNTYHVPVQTYSSSAYFVSGYEVKSYVKSQTDKSLSKYGLMENIYNYDIDVQCLVLVLVLLLLTVILVQNTLRVSYLRHRFKGVTIRYLSRRRLKKLKPSKLTKFIYLVSFFFLSTPFLLMFKTNQVVTEKPFVLENYQMIMDARARIRTSGLNANITLSLEPSGESVKTQDIIYKFYNYYIHHQYKGVAPSRKQVYYDNLFEIAESIINNTMVYLDTYHTVHNMRLVFCSMSNESQLYRTFIFRDESSREILAGKAFRLGYVNHKLTKRLRSTFELGTTTVWTRMHPLPLGFRFRGEKISSKHRKAQLEHCLDEELKPYERHKTFASGFSFFGYFFAFLLVLDFTWLLLHLMQIVFFALIRPRKRKRSQVRSTWIKLSNKNNSSK